MSDITIVFNKEGSSRMVRICDEKNMTVISSYDKRFQDYPFLYIDYWLMLDIP